MFHRHWLKHTAEVPKGFLRYSVIELLGTKPMSGSEIMKEIEDRTGWRPSPGSVYPLLAWLQEKGFIEKVCAEEVDVKRFTLTDKGKSLREENRRRREAFRERAQTMGRIWHGFFYGRDGLYEANVNLINLTEDVRLYVRKEEDRWAFDEVKKILLKATEDIKVVKDKLTGD